MSAVSVEVIAKLLDMTPRRVQQLANEGVVPKPKRRGEYEIVPCVVGYIRHLRAMLDGEAGDMVAEKTRLMRAQAEKTEIEVAVLNGKLVPVADCERAWSALVGAARSVLLTLPARAAPECLTRAGDEEAIERTLTDMVYEALSELSNWKPDEEFAEEAPGEGDPGGDSARGGRRRAAAKAHGEPMGQ
jgi:phage terminase Nu1 subunit (DNA packaging protein)